MGNLLVKFILRNISIALVIFLEKDTGIVYKGTLITDNKKRFAVKAIDMKKFKKCKDIAFI